jgi:hypothetical protein
MKKKAIRAAVYLTGVLAVSYVFVVPEVTLPVRLRIESIYFTNRYRTELKMTEGHLKTMAIGDQNRVRQMFYDDFYITERPESLGCLHRLLQFKNIEGLNMLLLERHMRDNPKRMRIVTFLENDLTQYLIISYKEHKKGWLIERISLSDKLQHEAELLCK